MRQALRYFGASALALIAAAPFPGAAQETSGPGGPRTISNTAVIEWDAAGGTARLASNRVDLVLATRPLTGTIATWRVSQSGETISLAGSRCLGSSDAAGSVVALADPLPGDARVAPTSELAPGQLLVLRIASEAANTDPGQVDTLEISIATADGDHERLTFIETGASTGIFVAAIATAGMPPAPTDFDCLLSVRAGAMLSLAASQGSDPAPFASAELRVIAGAPQAALVVAKEAAVRDAVPGEAVQYQVAVRNPDPVAVGPITVTDALPAGFRIRPASLTVDGQAPAAYQIAPEGRGFTLTIPTLRAGGAALIRYAAEVLGGAPEGVALNRVHAVDSGGTLSNVAEAAIRVRRDPIAGAMTIVGRVTDGGCQADDASAPGIAGVRVLLEDGRYAITDQDGRYHFEGVDPGTHIVQLDEMTLPADRRAARCTRNTRAAGRAFSRFVEGRGGALMRADFRAEPAPERRTVPAARAPRAAEATSAQAAGAERDWLAGQEPGIAWLFPEAAHNPRAPIVRVAIKHRPGQTVRLLSAGRPVDPVAFEGTSSNPDGTVAVSLWRGIPLEEGATQLTAEIVNGDGTPAQTLRRTLHYGGSPIAVELLRERSVLVADGITRPVLAVRFTDRDGRPVRHGVVGDFEVPAPYYPAVEADAQQARQLAGLERARPFWRIADDDGIAYIELEPTTASGTVSLRFSFRDGQGQQASEQRIAAWLDPGDRDWTVVGLAQGTVGRNPFRRRPELDDVDGRLAFYASGPLPGSWQLTLAYDSDRDEESARFGGIIDPDAYYTIYADRSETRYDAASIRRFYARLERPQFYALFGDFETAIDEPELARYLRAFNGFRAEYGSDRLTVTAFAADAASRHRRDEIQGNGLTGPYALAARGLLPNSERITLETRDRLRSDRIVERRLLTRHIDYDIDYVAGTLRFREPILSRSSALDPQFIIAEYEVEGVGGRSLNAGGRVSWRSADRRLQVAATALRDAGDGRETLLAGADVRFRPSPSTVIRAEVAVSDESRDGAPAAGTSTAWQIEAEHHGPRYDLLAYAGEREAGFGLGHTSAAESGIRKFGLDARARLGEDFVLTGSVWHEEYLGSLARRIAARGLAEYRVRDFSARAGLTFADDRLGDGRTARSTILQLGLSRLFLDNRLELDAQTEIPLGGEDESIDFPARHRLSGRFAVTSDVSLVATYEIADGEHVDARTARLGFDLRPWAGARIALSGNVQDIAEYGPRSFAAFGLSQSLVVDEHWSIDLSVDGNETVGGIDPARLLNARHPAASGGFIGGAPGTVTEDFTAVTAGATFRSGRWSATGRAEYRAGDQGDRYGLTAAALRQIGEGSAVGGAVNWFVAEGEGGVETRTAALDLSWAHRPAGSRWSWLERLELREDRVSGAVAGQPGPIGIPLTITGNARSRRIVNSLSVNYTLPGSAGAELSFFWGSRYVSERLGEDDIDGWTNLIGIDWRHDLSETLDVGLSATLRHGFGADSLTWSGGPSVGLTPFDNGWLSAGWNFVGFHDSDFEDGRYTRSGPYVTMRMKFDQLSLEQLGLGRRP